MLYSNLDYLERLDSFSKCMYCLHHLLVESTRKKSYSKSKLIKSYLRLSMTKRLGV